MKLELKHIAPYLPYGLKFRNGKEFDVVTGIDNNTVISLFRGHLANFTSIEEIKPILRPLSDLTKEIEVDGKRFVPIDIFEISDSENADEYDFGNVKLIRSLRILANYGIVNDVKYLPYGVIQLLLSWHFDLFGLIEKGLAVDINTLSVE